MKILTTCLLNYDPSTTADCSGVGRFSIWGGGGGGGANLGIDRFIVLGVGDTIHFKVMGVGGWPLLLPPPQDPQPLFLRLWTVYFNWEGGELYLFYRASQFYDLRSFLPFNWKKMKICVMLECSF